MPTDSSPIVVLAGGVGAARFLEGLVQVALPQTVTVVVNVGDDFELAGLSISPDLDTVTYTLAGRVNPETGWGLYDDTFTTLDALAALGGPTWFRLGDRDLATHLYRTQRLRDGAPLSVISGEIARALGVTCRILPATDGRLRTMVHTDAGELAFQDYFVRRRQQDDVRGIRFEGADCCVAAPEVSDAIRGARAVIVAPSNPFVSIGPILAVPGLRDCLLTSRAPVAAVTPIIGGAAIKGPAAAMLGSLGHDVSALGVARLYQDLVDVFVLDQADAAAAPALERETGMRCAVTQTLMTDAAAKQALAATVLEALGV